MEKMLNEKNEFNKIKKCNLHKNCNLKNIITKNYPIYIFQWENYTASKNTKIRENINEVLNFLKIQPKIISFLYLPEKTLHSDFWMEFINKNLFDVSDIERKIHEHQKSKCSIEQYRKNNLLSYRN